MRVHETPAAWAAEDLRRDTGWMVELSPSQSRELRAVVEAQSERGLDLLDYERRDFDLSKVSERLDAVVTEAKRGRGIGLVRGLPVEGLTEDQFRLLVWAIGLSFGVPLPQGKESQYVSAVRDIGADYGQRSGRGYPSKAPLDLHTDYSDLVLLGCMRKAKSRGESIVSSSVRTHNALLRTSPRAAETLYQPFPHFRQDELPDVPASFAHPVFGEHDGCLFARYTRRNIQVAQGLPGVPELTQRQREALDRFDEVAGSEEQLFTMTLEPGDLQILNNHVALHGRIRFEDHDAPDRRRLLFRLWLAHPDSRELPPAWRQSFRSTAAGTVRGGILGHRYDERRRTFESNQASAMNMVHPLAPIPV